MGKAFWIWYPGDFELYHGMKQNFSRIERGFGWPAFWKSEGIRNRVSFRREYTVSRPTDFTVKAYGVGHVLVNNDKYPLGKTVHLEPGEYKISVHLGRIDGLPCAYIDGNDIFSDRDWIAEDYVNPGVKVGICKYYTDKNQNPCEWDYAKKDYYPVSVTSVKGGVLVKFETEINAQLEITMNGGYCDRLICFGETDVEALDEVHCYYSFRPNEADNRCELSAFRYAFIPDCEPNQINVKAIHNYVDMPVRAAFKCDNELLNRIWEVAEHTFMLCSGIFFIDGAKRDKWIWSGDAYQSLFVNQYLLADPDIEKRTLIALRGNDPVTGHINTILDYSLLWIMGVWKHFESYGDKEFLEEIYPKMASMMDYLHGQLDENGFLIGRPGDWIYIDWAKFDKDGPFCPEQMLYLECLNVMDKTEKVLGIPSHDYMKEYEVLKARVNDFYWNKELGAYIDSYTSGNNNVTRHANIFAVLYNIADENQKKSIIENVTLNDKVPAITTPYFKFFELDMLCKEGFLEEVLDIIKSYWGGMLERGAVTFWEEFNPNQTGDEQYDMYGDKFGKSLCHAWAASPIYFISKYYVGLNIHPGGTQYDIKPNDKLLKNVECTLPVGSKDVHISF